MLLVLMLVKHGHMMKLLWTTSGGMPCTQCARSAHTLQNFVCWQLLEP